MLVPGKLEILAMRVRDPYEKIRASAAEELGAIDDPRAVDLLAEATKDKVKDVRINALRSLARIASMSSIAVLIRSLEDSRADVRIEAARLLGSLKVREAVPKLDGAIMRELNTEAKETMLQALGQIGDARSIRTLSKFINDRSSAIRWTATWALGKIGRDTGSREAIDVLLRIERFSACKRCRREAATALRYISPLRI